MVVCHPLPSGVGKPRRFIARFHNRTKAQKIFTMKKTKDISSTAKGKLATDKGKGLGILLNLPVKRGRLFAQIKRFNDLKKYDVYLVDINTGKIILKVAAGTTRERLIRNTSI